MSTTCAYFESDRCHSCSNIRTPYAEQLERKQTKLRELLAGWPDLLWLEALSSAPSGFRCKAKMAAGGSIDTPTLGLADNDGATDLAECLLYPASLSLAFAPIKQFISAARLQPYDIASRRGELKFVLLTLAAHSGELMLRLVLRSRVALAGIQRALPALRRQLPQLRVISANLQPLHAAILEGEEEIALDGDPHLRLEINGLPMFLRPRGFFQTNPEVAAALYRQAKQWVEACAPASVLDLYCGVGGFALHCADGRRQVLGVELSAEAIEGARKAAAELGVEGLRFAVGDATATTLSIDGGDAELVIVNPPRRGLGDALCATIEHSAARWLIYSSCNPATLIADLRRMPSLQPRQARLLDMFPHTDHAEVLLLLQRSNEHPIQPMVRAQPPS
jgi:23S rRNA (uracil747-C5)-methyltransferase